MSKSPSMTKTNMGVKAQAQIQTAAPRQTAHPAPTRKRPPRQSPAPPGPNHTVLRELSRLPELTIAELKEQYRSLFGKPPPFHTQAFLIKRIAYRLQEIAYGGVSEAAHLKMTALLQKHGMAQDGFPPKRSGRAGGAAGGGANGKTGPARATRGGASPLQGLHPGTVLRREWDGVLHEVRVESHGFVWQGQRYASLSRVARMITGTNWNGPRFFGLRQKPSTPTQEGGVE